MAFAREGGDGPAWFVAREQTGGRGRRGRAWSSPPGNLYASCLLTEPCAPDRAPQLGFVAGVALIEAARTLVPRAGLQLKWPNDLLFGDAKLSGILLEASRLADGRFVCVAGIGVNCRSHPDGLPYPATNLSALAGAPVEPDALLDALAAAFSRRLAEWDRGDGFPDIRAAWLRDAAGLGKPVEIAGPPAVRGRFETIDAEGRLVVATDRGRLTFDAADVRFTLAPAQPLRETAS